MSLKNSSDTIGNRTRNLSPASIVNILVIQQVVCKVCVKGSNRRLFIKLWVASSSLLNPLIISVVEAVLNQSRFVGGTKLKNVNANCRCTSDKMLTFLFQSFVGATNFRG